MVTKRGSLFRHRIVIDNKTTREMLNVEENIECQEIRRKITDDIYRGFNEVNCAEYKRVEFRISEKLESALQLTTGKINFRKQ